MPEGAKRRPCRQAGWTQESDAGGYTGFAIQRLRTTIFVMKMDRLIPMLPVASVSASVSFYCETLGFEIEAINDKWGWAMLRFDDCRLMVDQSINAHPAAPRNFIVYLYPEDVVAYHGELRSKGLAVPELTITFYGLTEFRISDPDGNRLWIGQATKK